MLRDLYDKAGRPSTRSLALEIDRSHTTVAALLKGSRNTTFGTLDTLFTALGGTFDAEWFSQGPGVKDLRMEQNELLRRIAVALERIADT